MAVKKAMVKKTPTKKAAARGKAKVGDRLVCGVCGISVTVDDGCGCAAKGGAGGPALLGLSLAVAAALRRRRRSRRCR